MVNHRSMTTLHRRGFFAAIAAAVVSRRLPAATPDLNVATVGAALKEIEAALDEGLKLYAVTRYDLLNHPRMAPYWDAQAQFGPLEVGPEVFARDVGLLPRFSDGAGPAHTGVFGSTDA